MLTLRKGQAKYYVCQIEEFKDLLNAFQNTEEENPKEKKIKRDTDIVQNLSLYYIALGDKR